MSSDLGYCGLHGYHVGGSCPLCTSTPLLPQPQRGAFGWECPVCRNVYAPHVPSCFNCANRSWAHT